MDNSDLTPVTMGEYRTLEAAKSAADAEAVDYCAHIWVIKEYKDGSFDMEAQTEARYLHNTSQYQFVAVGERERYAQPLTWNYIKRKSLEEQLTEMLKSVKK